LLTRLPHRVIVQAVTRTTFSGGAYTTSWTSASVEWANCQQISAEQTSVDQQPSRTYEKIQQMNKWKVIMRAGVTVSNKHRLLYGTKILMIETVNDPTNRSRMLSVVCREEVI
jgi:head-tail adaptor